MAEEVYEKLEQQKQETQDVQELIKKTDLLAQQKPSFFGGNKKQEAFDLYEKAVNKLKAQNQLKEAGDTLVKMLALTTEPSTLIKLHENAAHCFQNCDEKKRAIEMYTALVNLQTTREILPSWSASRVTN